MIVIDKDGKLTQIAHMKRVIVELGCGDRKRLENSIGVDVLDLPAVDIIGDAVQVLASFPSTSVDEIHAYHFLEHVADLSSLMSEVARVLRPGGCMDIVVPHFSNAYYYSDPTHRTPFGLYSMCYYATDAHFRRKVPSYSRRREFDLISVDLRFKSTPPFYFRHALRRCFGVIFNSCYYMQEFYEENMTSIMSCYELRYIIKKRSSVPER